MSSGKSYVIKNWEQHSKIEIKSLSSKIKANFGKRIVSEQNIFECLTLSENFFENLPFMNVSEHGLKITFFNSFNLCRFKPYD